MNFPRDGHDLQTLDLEHLAPQPFDPLDEDCIHDLVGKRCADPVHDLMRDLDEYEKIAGSFGQDWIKTAEMLSRVMTNLKRFRDGLHEQHKEDI